MSTPAANTFPSEAGSIDTGIAEVERVTATVNSEEVVETGLFTATVTAQAHLGSNTAAAPDAKTGAQAPPKFIRPNFDLMPIELKEQKNWLLWGAVRNGSKWIKRPIQRSGYGASTTNPKHWSSFDDVKQAYEHSAKRGYMELRERGKPAQKVVVGGVGFVFDGRPDEDGLVFAGVDFDKVIPPKGEISSFAAERVKRLGSYCEQSVSRTGLHVILKARPLASGIAHNGTELYTGGRYFTMTGCTKENAQVVAAPEPFASLAEELRHLAGKSGGKGDDPPHARSDDVNLDEFESAVRYLGRLSPSPLKDYPGWRDFMFACAHAETTTPAARGKIRQIFSEVSTQSGGDTGNNDRLYEEALTATQEKLGQGIEVITAASIINLARVQGWTSETTVNYVPGNENACRTALDNVVAADLSTFTSGDILTILRVPDQEKPGLERWGGDLPGTTPALPADVIERAERLTWMAPTGGKGEQRWKRCKPPRDFCTDYITQRRGRYAARLLLGIARVPFIRDDGTIRSDPGYDPDTGIFVDRSPKLTVPDLPTLDDAKAALLRVMKPYEYYVFEDPENGPRQVLAANLTALERPYMKTAPMFVVNGVQAGTGKGQLCRAIGRLALGTTPPFMSWGHDDDEFKKRFDTMLLASPAMLVMDNCNGRVLRGDTLEMILSEGEATIRQFNKLEAITVRSRTFLMANGNNIQISGDMSRRGIKINILPTSQSPESDVFPFTPEDYVIAHRDALLSDYYTIMRAFRHAGMPRSGLPAVGSFPEWERKVRDLIFWLTGHDLSGDFKKNKLDDPEQQEDAALLSALRHFFRERWFKAAEIDATLKRVTERRRSGVSGAIYATSMPGPKTIAAMKQNKAQTIAELIQAMEDGNAPVDPDVLREIMAQREQADLMKKEDALLEATEQKFGAKSDYAKTLGNWARGIQKKFVDGLILHRQEDPHTKIFRIMVGLASSTEKE